MEFVAVVFEFICECWWKNITVYWKNKHYIESYLTKKRFINCLKKNFLKKPLQSIEKINTEKFKIIKNTWKYKETTGIIKFMNQISV